MAFSGDKQIVESILFDVSGSAIALTHSASIDMTTQAGVALAGVFSSSSGYTARVLQVDDEGRLMVDAQLSPSGVQTVTGSVALSQPAVVTDGGGSLTVDGTVNVGNFPAVQSVDDNGGSLTVDDGGGSLTIDGTVTANVTGTVNLDRGNDASLPLYITGSINAVASGVQTVTGSVALSQPAVVTDGGGSLTIDGTVTANVTGTVNLDRGNDAVLPLFVTGSVGITNTVTVDAAIHTTASGTYFLSTATPVTIAASSVTRRGLTIYNESNKAMYIKFGTGVTTTDYTYKIFSDDGWVMPDFLYSGVITAVWATAGSLGAQVTIITP
jgi:hypothetical protein